MSGTRRKPGALGPFVEGYRARLLALGYTPSSTRNVLKDLGRLGRWMTAERVEVVELTEGRLAELLESRRAAGHNRVPGLRSFAPLLDYLRDEGIVAAAAPVPVTPVDELIARYRRWLVTDRGLAPATVLRYEKLARRFLSQRVTPDGVRTEDVSGADVTGFLLAECGRLAVGSAKGRLSCGRCSASSTCMA